MKIRKPVDIFSLRDFSNFLLLKDNYRYSYVLEDARIMSPEFSKFLVKIASTKNIRLKYYAIKPDKFDYETPPLTITITPDDNEKSEEFHRFLWKDWPREGGVGYDLCSSIIVWALISKNKNFILYSDSIKAFAVILTDFDLSPVAKGVFEYLLTDDEIREFVAGKLISREALHFIKN
jgi:hypothetical protein